MKIGLNSMTFNNDIEILKNMKTYIDTYECTKLFLLENKQLLDLDIKCDTFSSLIVGKYDLSKSSDEREFTKEFRETCTMANDLGCTKLMFGMERFRKCIDKDVLDYFVRLIDIAKEYNLSLLYEAITDSLFLPTHKSLVEFSSKHHLDGVHVDFGTMFSNKYDYSIEDILSKTKILNAHVPFGLIIKNIPFDVSFENYTKNKLSEKDIKEFLEKLRNEI